MKVTVRPELRMVYPGAIFGYLTVRDAANMRQHEGLEEAGHDVRLAHPKEVKALHR